MKTLGFLNPKAGAGQSRLIFNLGWVLADAGFRVGLVDFDPQAGLTELAGASGEAQGSIYGALVPLLTSGELETPASVELDPNLWLVRGHILSSTFDDLLAAAWTPSADPRAQAILRGVRSMLADITEQHELDVVLCDLGSSLGPFCRATATAVDAIVVPLAPRAGEDAVLRSLSGTLQRWHGTPPSTTRSEASRTLGFVIVRPSGLIEVSLEQLAAAYHRELNGEHLGTIKEFPSLVSIARLVHKPEILLTLADGAAGSLSSAVDDLRRQFEALATRITTAAGLIDNDSFIERLEQVLHSELDDDLPGELDSLSSHTAIQSIADVEPAAVEIRRGGLRVLGSASVDVALGWGGSRDGSEMSRSFPLRFDLELDRSHESVTQVFSIRVDTSSFSE